MRTLPTVFLSLALCGSGFAQGPPRLTLPPSGNNQKASVTQYIGPVEITINYSSPAVHSPTGEDRRGKIWGQLVAYGLVMLACAIVALLTYRYLAFGSDLLAGVTEVSRRRFHRQVVGGPILYAAAVAVAFLSAPVAIGLYLVIPLAYLFVPRTALVEVS